MQQRDAEGGAVPATVSDDSTTRTASPTPSAALRTRTACTVIVDSRTTDTAGDALTATSPITTTAGTQPSAARDRSPPSDDRFLHGGTNRCSASLTSDTVS